MANESHLQDYKVSGLKEFLFRIRKLWSSFSEALVLLACPTAFSGNNNKYFEIHYIPSEFDLVIIDFQGISREDK
ncbi:hypothetical protein H8356DRAFT_1352150 [Neocallimastix lanati (nom. inval.)]|nr:hypothetical protein H8356DRAFT_1352150 [Neocallimastix sp. JGI-2020a]